VVLSTATPCRTGSMRKPNGRAIRNARPQGEGPHVDRLGTHMPCSV
jgi:hypothetical protein